MDKLNTFNDLPHLIQLLIDKIQNIDPLSLIISIGVITIIIQHYSDKRLKAHELKLEKYFLGDRFNNLGYIYRLKCVFT